MQNGIEELQNFINSIRVEAKHLKEYIDEWKSCQQHADLILPRISAEEQLRKRIAQIEILVSTLAKILSDEVNTRIIRWSKMFSMR